MSISSRKRESASPARVLVVDDDQELCELMSLRLAVHGYGTTFAHDERSALSSIDADRPDAVILDLRLGRDDGLEVLAELLKRAPGLQVVVLTAHGSIETAVEAMRRGAIGFMTKPFRDSELLDNLARAVERTSSVPPNAPDMPAAAALEARLIGQSHAMRELRELVQRVGFSNATVLVTGESGTGKELVARALHDLSPRYKGPFVPLNCGALPPALLTGELFGHVKGSFTGATHDREGVFGVARGGTLFLDEIREAPHDVQVRLLRVLQEQRYTPVGSNVEKQADVRVIAATNRDLRAEVLAKRFREDLYYRLHVVPLTVPPLRERTGDIALLIEVFLARVAVRDGRSVAKLTAEALELLCSHAWPGNVRQLGHVVEAAALLTPNHVIDHELIARLITPEAAEPTAIQPRVADPEATSDAGHAARVLSPWFEGEAVPPFSRVRKEFERMYLVEVLRRARGNVTLAARMAGRHRTDFYELLNRHNLNGSSFRTP
jgi:two-component system response regulator GlrR